MEYDLLFWFLAVLSAIFVGLGKGGLPIVAMLSVPLLSLVMPTIAAASLLLPVYIVSDIFALIFYRKDFEYNVLKIGIFGMTIGVLIGWATAHVVIEWIVTLIIGLMGTLYALKLIFSKFINEKEERSLSRSKGIFWCTIAGFTSFISHNGGPPWQIFILPIGLSKSVYVGTSVIAFSYVNAIKIPPYFFLGQINLDTLQVAFYLIFPAALAVYFGYQLVRLISDKLFFNIVSWALLIISLKLIWDGLQSAF